jgi:AsmA protein
VIAPVRRKRLIFAVTVLALAGLGALLIMPFLMSTDAVREAVTTEIRAVTGFNPVLRGKISASLFPTGSVKFEDVVLGENGPGAPALTAQQVIARLRFFPLLIGRIEVADVSLLRPTIAITWNEDGNLNWAGQIEALAQNLRPGPRRAASFSEIRIEDGTIIVRHPSHKIVETLSNVHLALAWPSISRSFAATGRFNWHDQPVDTSISLADFMAALQGERSGLKVRLAGAPLRLGFDGYLSHRPTLRMEGTVAADSASLRETLRWIGQQQLPGGGLGRFALKAQANVAGTTIGLSGAHLELDDNTSEGVLSFDGRQTLQGTLAAETLDLSPYVSTVRLLTGGEHAWDNKPVSLNGITGFDVDLRISAARVNIGSAKLGRTAVAATLHGNHFNVAIGESEAFGGVVKGTLGLAKAPAGADFKAQLQFLNVDLDQCLGEMFGIRRLEGKGNLGVDIESAGASVYDLAKGLNGTATLSSRKGAITGFNVEQLLRRIERRPLAGGGMLRTGKTPYDTLTVNLRITDGIANVQDVRMEGSAVGLALTGSASIPARELDLKGTASLLTSGATGPAALLPSFELPFMVQGPWDDPVMLPDPEILMQRSGAAAPLLDAVRNRGAPEAVRSAIERLTGSARSASPPSESAPAPAVTVSPGEAPAVSASPPTTSVPAPAEPEKLPSPN